MKTKIVTQVIGVVWIASVILFFYMNKSDLTYLFGWEHHLQHDAFPIPLRFLMALIIALPFAVASGVLKFWRTT